MKLKELCAALWLRKSVVTLAQVAKDYSGRNAFTKTKGKNDRSILFPSKPEV